jgi:hypothetical protein
MGLRPASADNPIQAFPPDPSKTTTLTLTAGTATWTPTAGTKIYVVQPTVDVVQKLNTSAANGTTGLTLSAGLINGPFAIHGATASITFTGTAGQTLIIEAD